jgi:hypothetical protein
MREGGRPKPPRVAGPNRDWTAHARERHDSTLRANRSNRATMTTSNFRALASFIRRSSARPGILTTADSFVAIFLDDLKATMGRIVAQCDSLSLCSLAVALGTDSHVEGCAFHCCPLAQGRFRALPVGGPPFFRLNSSVSSNPYSAVAGFGFFA